MPCVTSLVGATIHIFDPSHWHLPYALARDIHQSLQPPPQCVCYCNCDGVADTAAQPQCGALERLIERRLDAAPAAPAISFSVHFVFSFGLIAFLAGLLVGCVLRSAQRVTFFKPAGPIDAEASEELPRRLPVKGGSKGGRGVVVQVPVN